MFAIILLFTEKVNSYGKSVPNSALLSGTVNARIFAVFFKTLEAQALWQ